MRWCKLGSGRVASLQNTTYDFSSSWESEKVEGSLWAWEVSVLRSVSIGQGRSRHHVTRLQLWGLGQGQGRWHLVHFND